MRGRRIAELLRKLINRDLRVILRHTDRIFLHQRCIASDIKIPLFRGVEGVRTRGHLREIVRRYPLLLQIADRWRGQNTCSIDPMATTWLIHVRLLAETLVFAQRVDERGKFRELTDYGLVGTSTWGQKCIKITLVQHGRFGALL